MTPAWILDLFAAFMLIVAAVSAARLVVAQPWRTRPAATGTGTDVAHLLIGIAMAGMLASSLTTPPSGAWQFVFGLLTALFAYWVVRDIRANGVYALVGRRCAPQLVHSAAMFYTYVALAAPATSAGSAMARMDGSGGTAIQTLRYPTLAVVFALILAGCSIWDLDQLSGGRYSLTGADVSLARVAPADVPALVGTGSAVAALSGIRDRGNSMTADSRPGVAARGHVASGDVDFGSGFASCSFVMSPGAMVGCRIAMGVTMAFMLLIMI